MTADASPHRLLVDDARTPLGTALAHPRFSWTFPTGSELGQEAYRVVVGTTRDRVAARRGTVWDSGWSDGAAQATRYDGPALEPRTRYWWTVGTRSAGHGTSWAEPTWFETGIGDWDAAWIGPSGWDQEAPAPVFQRSFSLEGEVRSARLYLAVGGLYEATINGERIGEGVLDTAVTDYDERVLYVTHDVTDLLTAGENTITVTAGRGRYALTTENTWGWHEAPWHEAHPHLLAQLEIGFEDGSDRTVRTDEEWTVREGPTRFDSIYEGDVVDTRTSAETGPTPATDVAGPAGSLVPQSMEPMRIAETLEPASIDEPQPGVYVFDFDEMTAGWTTLRVDESPGTEVVLRHGEKRAEDGTVVMDQPHVAGAFQTDRYVLSGDGTETVRPRFSYKGFQFVEVRGLSAEPTAETVQANVIHSAVDDGPTSEFACDNDLLTRIHANSRRTFLNNFHGIPTDTPAYEKNGWTGDALAGAPAAWYHFPMARFFRKWLADFADAQRPDGEVPPIVPTSDFGYSHAPFGEGITSPNPGWDAAYLTVAWTSYMHTGDERFLADHYDGLTACVDYFDRHAEDGLLDDGLGDWLAPGHGEIRARPPEGTKITGTAYYYRVVDLLGRIASALDREADATTYATHASEIKRAFNEAFLDRQTSIYATGEADEYRQTSNVLPLAFGLVPDAQRAAVVDNLVADVMETHDGHLNTGFHGTPYLLPVLTDAGHVDVAYTIATQETYPSWGHWITEHDATTHYEMWDLESRSRNHYAYGAIDEWFYGHLAGVRPATPGFERVEISPSFPTGLDWVDATVETVRGPITAAWRRTDPDRVALDVTLPGNTAATVELPTGDTATCNGRGITEARAVKDSARSDGSVRCTVGPGEHTFTCPPQQR